MIQFTSHIRGPSKHVILYLYTILSWAQMEEGQINTAELNLLSTDDTERLQQ